MEPSSNNLPMNGIRVIEVASWWFVPAAGAVLADWGADVIKVEPPIDGDPQRALLKSGLLPSKGDVNFMMEQSNRGKRSIALDLTAPEGLDLLYDLVRSADVFVTSMLPSNRQRLGIDLEAIREQNPEIIYVRGSGFGPNGPDADSAGYDATAFWTRSGIADLLTAPDAASPTPPPGGAFGDSIGAVALAGGVSTALLKRERTGEPSVVDVSLLGTALWCESATVVATKLLGFSWKLAGGDRMNAPNPLLQNYQTADGGWIMFNMLNSSRYWESFCAVIGHPELADDERFVDDQARSTNKVECIEALDEVFASATLAEWRERLDGFDGAWAPLQSPYEVHDDLAAIENGYLPELTSADGTPFTLVTNPVEFDESWPELTPAPDHGADSDSILTELGVDSAEIADLKDREIIR